MDKRKAAVLIVLFLMVLSLVRMNPSVKADLGTPIDSGWASPPPVINGNITAGEWANATVRDFTIQMRSRLDGSINKTLNGRLYVENNLTYVFLAVQIFNDDYEAHDFGGHWKGLAVLFSDNDSSTLVVGDNGEGVTTYVSSPFYTNNDLYYTGGGPGAWDADVSAGKTNDGSMKWSHTNATQGALGNWTFEMMIPLVGSDGSSYDFNITSLPYTVGFKVWFEDNFYTLDAVYPDDPTIAKSIYQTSNASTFGDITFYPLYNLTMVTTIGGTTNPAPGLHQYAYNTVVTATATPDPWYAFDHWELDSVNVGTTNPYNVTMNQNHTLKAFFHPLYALNITTTAGGTTTPAPGTYIYDNGTLVNVTATANLGYDFDHWILDGFDVGTSNPYHVLMTQNHTLNAVFVILPSVTISPTAITITLGNSVLFTSIVTGGTAPYSYQWYLGTSPYLGATSSSWTFTPGSIGTYYVYLNVTDLRGRIAVSNTSKVIVIPIAVGGYTVSLERTASTLPIFCYGALIAAFGTVTSIIRRKKK
ncbi:MAG: PKD domain-containing protein [Candidatus Bathyarchaeia archaeon]